MSSPCLVGCFAYTDGLALGYAASMIATDHHVDRTGWTAVDIDNDARAECFVGRNNHTVTDCRGVELMRHPPWFGDSRLRAQIDALIGLKFAKGRLPLRVRSGCDVPPKAEPARSLRPKPLSFWRSWRR